MAETRFLVDTYQEFIEKEGIPVVEDFGIDLLAVETKPWPRLGGSGAYTLRLELNAHEEAEKHGGPANSTFATALQATVKEGLIPAELEDVARAAAEPTLNRLMAMGNGAASKLRARLSDLLREDGPDRGRVEALRERLLVPMAAARMQLPARIDVLAWIRVPVRIQFPKRPRPVALLGGRADPFPV